MKELEDKIRESFPHLKNIEQGCIITEQRSGNCWEILDVNRVSETFQYYNPEDGLFEDTLETIESVDVIGHSIMLHDVLLYLKLKDCSINDATNDCLAFRKGDKTVFWNLFCAKLKDQEEDIIKFLNEL